MVMVGPPWIWCLPSAQARQIPHTRTPRGTKLHLKPCMQQAHTNNRDTTVQHTGLTPTCSSTVRRPCSAACPSGVCSTALRKGHAVLAVVYHPRLRQRLRRQPTRWKAATLPACSCMLAWSCRRSSRLLILALTAGESRTPLQLCLRAGLALLSGPRWSQIWPHNPSGSIASRPMALAVAALTGDSHGPPLILLPLLLLLPIVLNVRGRCWLVS